MRKVNYEKMADKAKLKRLLQDPNIKRAQANFLKSIIDMANQVPNFQAVEKTVTKPTYDRYFHFLIPRTLSEINCKRALFDCGIDINIDFDLKPNGYIDTAFTVSIGEIEKANGYYIKFIKQ